MVPKVAAIAEQPAKRKRGRPRKDSSQPTAVTPTSPSSDDTENNGASFSGAKRVSGRLHLADKTNTNQKSSAKRTRLSIVDKMAKLSPKAVRDKNQAEKSPAKKKRRSSVATAIVNHDENKENAQEEEMVDVKDVKNVSDENIEAEADEEDTEQVHTAQASTPVSAQDTQPTQFAESLNVLWGDLTSDAHRARGLPFLYRTHKMARPAKNMPAEKKQETAPVGKGKKSKQTKRKSVTVSAAPAPTTHAHTIANLVNRIKKSKTETDLQEFLSIEYFNLDDKTATHSPLCHIETTVVSIENNGSTVIDSHFVAQHVPTAKVAAGERSDKETMAKRRPHPCYVEHVVPNEHRHSIRHAYLVVTVTSRVTRQKTPKKAGRRESQVHKSNAGNMGEGVETVYMGARLIGEHGENAQGKEKVLAFKYGKHSIHLLPVNDHSTLAEFDAKQDMHAKCKYLIDKAQELKQQPHAALLYGLSDDYYDVKTYRKKKKSVPKCIPNEDIAEVEAMRRDAEKDLYAVHFYDCASKMEKVDAIVKCEDGVKSETGDDEGEEREASPDPAFVFSADLDSATINQLVPRPQCPFTGRRFKSLASFITYLHYTSLGVLQFDVEHVDLSAHKTWVRVRNKYEKNERESEDVMIGAGSGAVMLMKWLGGMPVPQYPLNLDDVSKADDQVKMVSAVREEMPRFGGVLYYPLTAPDGAPPAYGCKAASNALGRTLARTTPAAMAHGRHPGVDTRFALMWNTFLNGRPTAASPAARTRQMEDFLEVYGDEMNRLKMCGQLYCHVITQTKLMAFSVPAADILLMYVAHGKRYDARLAAEKKDGMAAIEKSPSKCVSSKRNKKAM